MRRAVRNEKVDEAINFVERNGGTITRRAVKNYFSLPRNVYREILKQDRLKMIQLRKAGYKIKEVANFMDTSIDSVACVLSKSKKTGEWDEVPDITFEDLTQNFIDEPETQQAMAESLAHDADIKNGMSKEEADKKYGFEKIQFGNRRFSL